MLFALDLQSQLRNRGVQLAFTTVVEVAKNEVLDLFILQRISITASLGKVLSPDTIYVMYPLCSSTKYQKSF